MIQRSIGLFACALLAIGCKKSATFSPAPVQSITTTINEATQPFFSAPWPDDRRLASDGTVATDYFPIADAKATLAGTLLTTGDHLVHGWGTSAPAYMPFTGAIDPTTLPTNPTAATGSVFILNIDPSSPGLGTHATVDFHYYDAPTSFLPGHVLAVRPVPGFPLLEKTQYAVVVTTAVKDTNGKAIGPQQAFWDVLQGAPQGATEQAAATFYKPLLTELSREKYSLSNVAGASIFTTQPITGEMITLRDYLLSLPAPVLDPGTLKFDSNISQAPVAGNPGYFVFEATYSAPNMQHGSPPFLLTGGDFEYDATGTPLVGFTEHIRLSIVVPLGTEPAGGWPVAVYSHGTGGNYLSDVNEYEPVAPTIVESGIAVFGIDQILTGPRSGLPASAQPTGCFDMPVENCFIDPINAVAGRNNMRQSALDNITLRRLIQNPATMIPASLNILGQPITFNPSKIGFIGHSQGGFTGALYLPLDPVPLGGVVSGAGGLVTATILERTSPAILPLVEGPLLLNLPAGESLDWYHPALALVQTLAEAVDPINWGAHWVTDPLPGGTSKSLYTTSGLLDADNPSNTAEFLNNAAHIPQLNPLPHVSAPYAVSGIAPVSTPLTGNLTAVQGGTVTGAFHQYPPPANHFVIFDNRESRHQWSAFLSSLINTGRATIPVDCTACTCADGTCSDSTGACSDGTNCTLCSVCECFENGGNVCPTDSSGTCPNGYGNCTTCNVCECDDDTCPIDSAGNCDDQTNCTAPLVDGGMQ